LKLDLDDMVVVYSKSGDIYHLWEAYKINFKSSQDGESTVSYLGYYNNSAGLNITQDEIWERRRDFQVRKCINER